MGFCIVFCISVFYPATLVFVLPSFLCFLSFLLSVISVIGPQRECLGCAHIKWYTPQKAAAMARQLSAALAENWSVIPTHMMAHEHLLQFQVINTLFWPWFINIHLGKTLIHIKVISLKYIYPTSLRGKTMDCPQKAEWKFVVGPRNQIDGLYFLIYKFFLVYLLWQKII